MPIFITFPLEKEWLTVFPTPKLICSNFLHLIVDHWLLILDQNRSSLPPLPSPPPPPSSASANHCGEIINTSREGKNPNILTLSLRRVCLIKKKSIKVTQYVFFFYAFAHVSTQVIKTQADESDEFLL